MSPFLTYAAFDASMHLLGLAGGVALSLAFESRNFRRGRLKVNWLLVAVAGAIVTGALVTGCFRSLHLICTLPRWATSYTLASDSRWSSHHSGGRCFIRRNQQQDYAG